MKFHNRAMPYPLLDSSDPDRDDFQDCEFDCVIRDRVSDDGKTLFLSLRYRCNVSEIQDLIGSQKAVYALTVVGSSTLVRQVFSSTEAEQNIELAVDDFCGRVELIPQVVINDVVEGFTSEYLNPEYKDIAFDLFPGDVICVGCTEIRTFQFESLKIETLISAVLDEDVDENEYKIELADSKIYIRMGKTLHPLWGDLRGTPEFRPFLAMSIYKDCFMMALEDISSSEEGLDRRWADSLLEKVEAVGCVLTEDSSLDDLNRIAQKILTAETVKKLVKYSAGAN